MKYSYKNHLKKSSDLVTSYESRRSVFLAMALEKNRQATPMIGEAKALKVIASKCKDAKSLLKIKEIYKALLTASGLSDKSMKHLTDVDKNLVITNLIEKFLEPAGAGFVDELVYRFLLTKGDSLGGSMRNLAGYLGEVKLSRTLLSVLNLKGYNYFWLDSKSKKWIQETDSDADIEKNLKGIFWNNGKSRTLLYNMNVPIVKNNIDLILINGDARTKLIKDVSNNEYLAFGELKGGIDPAGADEHWKTANSALSRIRNKFSEFSLNPRLFFVGAAIESKMADEIFTHLESNTLDNACNLNNETQLISLCQWLISL